ncbi:MAG TPA: type IX secretion system sortase PorU, partial [Bacteroidales bacterium]
YADMQNWGVNMQSVNPTNIRVYGNPGGMLPQANASFRYDDLQENAIKVVTAKSDKFAQGDYILFYGTSPIPVKYNALNKSFEHVANNYSDKACYFLNFDLGPGKRIGVTTQSAKSGNHTSTGFTDFAYYENDLYNLLKSGNTWFGERLDNVRPTFDLPAFSFPNADNSAPAFIRYSLAGKSSQTASFTIMVNGTVISTPVCGSSDGELYGRLVSERKSLTITGPEANVSVRYNLPNSSALGWLDYVEMNVIRKMIYTGGQMPFADPATVGKDFVTTFTLIDIPAGIQLWEVTDPLNVHIVNASVVGNKLNFMLDTDSLRRFIANDNSKYYTATFVKKVSNQNLHAIGNTDMVIIAPSEFLYQARRLAKFHISHDQLSVAVVPLEQVYNEFSSGAPDVTAIRDFMRMLYNRASVGRTPRYLLLFGDGSYDNKTRLQVNTNFIPTFQTDESLNNLASYATDDYVGMYGPTEGLGARGSIDIGIGRFPVSSAEQAKTAVDKTIYYATNSPKNLGDWRNTVCFVGDDEDGDLHMIQAEQLAASVLKRHKEYNIDKIYLDAFKEISVPGGQRYPDVNVAINQRVEKGALLINYTGHGGEVGWAHERILELSDINSWDNLDNMPVFVTATCEFSRYDDPAITSAGEQVFLNPAGGGVALFTTSRIANAGDNVYLNQSFYDTVFSSNQGIYPRMGDIMAFSKNDNSQSPTIRNFILLGDPALRLAYPANQVITTSVNSNNVSLLPDSVKALSRVFLSGIVAGQDGHKLTDFTGILFVKVFDKPGLFSTLGNDPTSPKREFSLQKNILYQGKASVINGDFNLSFIVPKDIDYHYGFGKISYYVENGSEDAGGFYNNILIGGTEENLTADTQGPLIDLYMNDRSFLPGDIVGESPTVLAFLHDESGINTVGNGIGHDIVAVLDTTSTQTYVLNDYYVADKDSYQQGIVRYRFFNLPVGPHTLKLKVWDVYNNSSEAVVNFVVSNSVRISISDVLAYPNPCTFATPVNITFTHNLFDEDLDVKMDIFSLSGKLIKTIGPLKLQSEGYTAGPIQWNGKDASGNDVRGGMYIYRIRAIDHNNIVTEKSGKLIVVRNYKPL